MKKSSSFISQRNSSIEFLKVIAIVMIIACHSMPSGNTAVHSWGGVIDVDTATTDIQLIIAGFINSMGNVGNAIFIVCSAWFLLESGQVKQKKIVDMLGDSFFISVAMLLAFSLLGYDFSKGYFIKQFFPFTFGNCWFLTCYLLLYSIHPLLNHVIELMKQEELLRFNIYFFILYNCMGFLMKNNLFYYSRLIGFIGIYFSVAYMKKYMKKIFCNQKINVVMLLLGIGGWVISSILTILLGLYFEMFQDQMQRWNTFMNPCFILISISALNICRGIKMHNYFINYISSLSLLIYLIHATRIIIDYVRFDIFTFIKTYYTYEHLLVWIFVYSICNLVISISLAIIYKKTIQKYVHKIFERMSDLLGFFYNKVSGCILNIE